MGIDIFGYRVSMFNVTSVTKTEIARAAGVSRTCVSHVLNQNLGARIAASTRRRVLELAREMGYVPPITSRETHNRANTIAYVLCHERNKAFVTPWGFQVLSHLQRFAGQHDSCVIFLSGDEYAESQRQIMRSIGLAQPRGVILDGAVPEGLAQSLSESDVPFIVAGNTPLAVDPRWAGRITNVTVDIPSCVHQLMRWLHRRGARSIALISQPLDYLVDRLILQAYQAAVQFLGLTYDAALIQVCPDTGSATRILSHCQQLGIAYDGLLFATTTLAATVIPQAVAYARARGKSQPLMAAVGSPDVEGGNMNHAAMCGPQCSRFTQTLYDSLFEQIASPGKAGRSLEVPTVFRDPAGLAGAPIGASQSVAVSPSL